MADEIIVMRINRHYRVVLIGTRVVHLKNWHVSRHMAWRVPALWRKARNEKCMQRTGRRGRMHAR